jgi:Zn-dependent M28 family amino/carboxypeptidase
MNRRYIIVLCALVAVLCSCGGSKNGTTDTKSVVAEVSVPEFSADSAYQYVKRQVDFGPRVPNTKAHVACGDYLEQAFSAFGATVMAQHAELVAYDGTVLRARNIIASFQPEKKKRVVLFSHWDSRPWADNDPDPKNHYTPILGANDGASGVGVLLEIARHLGATPTELGVDIVLLDAEDYGTHQAYTGQHTEESWGLGAQYWARNPHVAGYTARFGILLDMVGGQAPTFYREYHSERYAKEVDKKVWQAARRLGYGNYFIDEADGGATDDHVFINRIAGIKTIDIVPYYPDSEISFDEHWHTVKDDMDNINPQTLKAVGQTVMHVVYNEQ